ncbi:MAG: hypothetical protein KY442_08435, partial [Proteobacteria bacterium]|nr:hypothetical protein [Pseudomonadota bacterium]
MKHPLALALAVALSAVAVPALAQSTPADTAANPAVNDAQAANPFFSESTLPLQYPPFDKIDDSDFAPAFERGMAEHLAEVEAIANNDEPATFDNTILAMEKAGRVLDRTATVFYSLAGADTNDTRQQLQAQFAPKLSAHRDAIALNPKLFARVQTLHDKRDELGLDAEGVRLIERYHTSFVRSGANLSEQDKTRLREINSELAALGTKFSQNVLAEVNASAVVVDTLEELDGLSDQAIAAAEEAAKERDLEGKYVLALQNTTGQPPNTYLTDRDLRQRIHEASVSRGSRGNEYDNTGIVSRVLKLRAERAAMMGYDTHAEYVLEDETAKTPEAVDDMLSQLAPAALANAKREAAALQAMIDREQAAKGEPSFELQPWDWAFYAEKVRQDQYNFDESQLKPYFEMKNVLENGVFYAANQVYGLTFKQRTDRLACLHQQLRSAFRTLARTPRPGGAARPRGDGAAPDRRAQRPGAAAGRGLGVTGSLTCLRVSGGLLPPDVVAGVLTGSVDGLRSGDFHLAGEAPREAAARTWTHLLGVWRRFREEL